MNSIPVKTCLKSFRYRICCQLESDFSNIEVIAGACILDATAVEDIACHEVPECKNR